MPQNIPIMHQILKWQRITSVLKAVYCQLTGLITAVIHHCYYVQLFFSLNLYTQYQTQQQIRSSWQY